MCIGIINSLSMVDKQFNKDNEDSFDLIIVDECHKLGANGFLQLLDIFSKSRYMLALSATPDRQDGKHIVYYSYFDKIIDVEI